MVHDMTNDNFLIRYFYSDLILTDIAGNCLNTAPIILNEFWQINSGAIKRKTDGIFYSPCFIYYRYCKTIK